MAEYDFQSSVVGQLPDWLTRWTQWKEARKQRKSIDSLGQDPRWKAKMKEIGAPSDDPRALAQMSQVLTSLIGQKTALGKEQRDAEEQKNLGGFSPAGRTAMNEKELFPYRSSLMGSQARNLQADTEEREFSTQDKRNFLSGIKSITGETLDLQKRQVGAQELSAAGTVAGQVAGPFPMPGQADALSALNAVLVQLGRSPIAVNSATDPNKAAFLKSLEGATGKGKAKPAEWMSKLTPEQQSLVTDLGLSSDLNPATGVRTKQAKLRKQIKQTVPSMSETKPASLFSRIGAAVGAAGAQGRAPYMPPPQQPRPFTEQLKGLQQIQEFEKKIMELEALLEVLPPDQTEQLKSLMQKYQGVK